MPYIVLAKTRVLMGAEAIELRDMGDMPIEHLEPLAQVAQGQGFELMYEFEEAPDMEEVGKRAPLGEVSAMDSMARLWVLSET